MNEVVFDAKKSKLETVKKIKEPLAPFPDIYNRKFLEKY